LTELCGQTILYSKLSLIFNQLNLSAKPLYYSGMKIRWVYKCDKTLPSASSIALTLCVHRAADGCLGNCRQMDVRRALLYGQGFVQVKLLFKGVFEAGQIFVYTRGICICKRWRIYVQVEVRLSVRPSEMGREETTSERASERRSGRTQSTHTRTHVNACSSAHLDGSELIAAVACKSIKCE
jgi:hypothetical protein